jgi:hypothetical protein
MDDHSRTSPPSGDDQPDREVHDHHAHPHGDGTTRSSRFALLLDEPVTWDGVSYVWIESRGDDSPGDS